jgi:hypothetical protein
MVERVLQGWYEDPFHLHEARYFSAGRPTKLVRDGGRESYDEPPADLAPAPADAPAGAADAPAGPGEPRPVAAGRPSAYAPDAPLEEPRRSRVGLVAAVAVVAIAAAGATVAVKDWPKGAAQAPAVATEAFITHSARTTLAARTADITMSGTLDASGQTTTLNGTGQIDLAHDAMALTLRATVAGQPFEEKEILTNGNLYLALTVAGKGIGQVLGGKEWLRMPLRQSQSADLVGSNPISSLATLEQQGSKVQSLGTETIDGVACTGYAVTPSTQAMIAGAKREYATLGLSASATQQELNLIQGMSPPAVKLWIDANGLVRRMSVSLSMTVGNGTAAGNVDESGDVVMDFSDFGAPVTVSAPPAADTSSYQSILGSLGGSSAS